MGWRDLVEMGWGETYGEKDTPDEILARMRDLSADGYDEDDAQTVLMLFRTLDSKLIKGETMPNDWKCGLFPE